ncbi:MAG: PIG-L family deacetylase [Flavobacteriales bacterium]|nr:PIG-L family deacetylase [Flavobacteriales bacterium]
MRRGIAWLLISCLTYTVQAQDHELKSTVEVYQDLQELQRGLRVLYLAAHPDDENTRLISWLENDQHVRTAYLSLTRGQGGQNLIGDEKGDGLGVIRTYELLEARKVDGGEQFFTRAIDFGYSKSAEESFEFWGREQVLQDVVQVIRTYRPHVIITRFPPTRNAGHGHHEASAILAAEAFDLAGDPKLFLRNSSRCNLGPLKYCTTTPPLGGISRSTISRTRH